MRKLVIVFFCLQLCCIAGYGQYWQQQVNYRIDVTLNDTAHSLSGFERIEYINRSPDTLRFIWFHLWPNAYKHDKTMFSDQMLENGSTQFYFSDKEAKGYINRLDFKVNNVTAQIEDHPQHIDIVKIVLPTPLAPGSTAIISTPFHVKLPFNVSRGGHDGQAYQATQWYPKPAVYDKDGWHPMTYLDQGEFYSEFGTFDVSITVPKNYIVAATGELQNKDEKNFLIQRSSDFIRSLRDKKEERKPLGSKLIKDTFPVSAKETKTLQYRQDNIHDFAWFADKRFIVNYDTALMASGKIVEVFTYYTAMEMEEWIPSTLYAEQALQFFSRKLGEYPYNVVSVVQGPKSFGGGMEYPTITVISPVEDRKRLDKVITHEVGHNWFYGILASNEHAHPWMDEGMTSFYQDKLLKQKDPKFNRREEQATMETLIKEKKDQPISTHSEKFNLVNYGHIAYNKAAHWMTLLEKELGTVAFDKAMQAYYSDWKFKHPGPGDFRRSIEKSSGKDLSELFALLDKKGPLPGAVKKGVTFQLPLPAMKIPDTLTNNVITVMPAFGFNSYDKVMVGLHITNLKFPPNNLQFLVSPMYATGSKTLNGIGFVNYSFYPSGIFRKIDVGVSGSKFSMSRFIDENDNKIFLSFNKLVPGVKLSFREKNPRSTYNRFIQFKSYLINEEGLRFSRDSIFNPPDTIIVNNVRKEKESRNLNQLRIVIENNRVLYPYRGELKMEQGEDFARVGFTGNYFFNYPKEGGLKVRLFAGKFIYTSDKTISKQFATDRFHLNMTGPNGYEDYTYSDYFVGRNLFEGFASQQIMVRDGAFKVRTDLLAAKVGRTDDWLVATNLSTTIPSGLNPLSILPIKIPLKIFVDIGTYAEAWETGADLDRFLYDAGLQLSLFNETVNIYLPLLYSRVFKEYIQSTIEKKGRLWKTVSFSIDISNFRARDFNHNFDF